MRGLLGLRRAEDILGDQPIERLGRAAPAVQRTGEKQLGHAMGIGRKQQLGDRRQLERLGEGRRASVRRERHRQRDIDIDVRVDRGQVAGLADVGVAVQQHKRHAPQGRVGQQRAHLERVVRPQIGVVVAERHVELDRQLLRGGLIERGEQQVVERAALGQAQPPVAPCALLERRELSGSLSEAAPLDMQAAAIGRDAL